MPMLDAMLLVTVTFPPRDLRVLRFWNNEVDGNMEGVLTLIDDALRNPPPGLASHSRRFASAFFPTKNGGRRPPIHPPLSGEG
jgi:hypothetical protein